MSITPSEKNLMKAEIAGLKKRVAALEAAGTQTYEVDMSGGGIVEPEAVSGGFSIDPEPPKKKAPKGKR